eukprot:m51a1_g1882 hypothetical protein (322) ;mRNA; r:693604-700865
MSRGASELNVCAVLPKRQAAWWEQLGRQTAGPASLAQQFRIVVGTATALSLVLAACWYERFFRHPEGVLPGLPWAVFLCHAGLCLLAWFATTDSALHDQDALAWRCNHAAQAAGRRGRMQLRGGVELDIEGRLLWLCKPLCAPPRPTVALEAQLHSRWTRTAQGPVRQGDQDPEQSPRAEDPAEGQPQSPVAALADTEVAASGEVPAYSYSQNEDTVTLVVRSEGCDPASLRLVLPDSLHARVDYELRATRAAPRRRVALAWELSAPVDVARCRCTASELNFCAVLPKRQAAWLEQLGRQTAGSCEPAKAAFTNPLVHGHE